MSPRTATPWTGRQSASRRQADLSNSKSPSRLGRRSTTIWLRHDRPRATIYFKGGVAIATLDAPVARLLAEWLSLIGLDPSLFGTHSLRRTKATLIYRRTGNLRAVQLLLGHTKIESTVRYLGIEVDDALAIAEQVEV
jgi:integrase